MNTWFLVTDIMPIYKFLEHPSYGGNVRISPRTIGESWKRRARNKGGTTRLAISPKHSIGGWCDACARVADVCPTLARTHTAPPLLRRKVKCTPSHCRRRPVVEEITTRRGPCVCDIFFGLRRLTVCC